MQDLGGSVGAEPHTEIAAETGGGEASAPGLPGAGELTAGGNARPAPGWVEHASTRADHLLHLDKHPTRAERRTEDVEGRMLAALDRIFDTFTLESETTTLVQGRLLRTLGNGLLFDSRIGLRILTSTPAAISPGPESLDPTALAAEIQLRIERGAAETELYRGRLEGHRISRLRSEEAEVPFGFDQQELHPNIPLSIGDLHLADLLGVRAALLDGNLDDLGELALGRSEFLRVIELRFPPYLLEDERSPQEDYTTRGASALLYFDLDSFRPRALRIFDRAGRLVRIYDHLIYAQAGDPSQATDPGAASSAIDPERFRLLSLRVSSTSDDSWSTFVLDRIETASGRQSALDLLS